MSSLSGKRMQVQEHKLYSDTKSLFFHLWCLQDLLTKFIRRESTLTATGTCVVSDPDRHGGFFLTFFTPTVASIFPVTLQTNLWPENTVTRNSSMQDEVPCSGPPFAAPSMRCWQSCNISQEWYQTGTVAANHEERAEKPVLVKSQAKLIKLQVHSC